MVDEVVAPAGAIAEDALAEVVDVGGTVYDDDAASCPVVCGNRAALTAFAAVVDGMTAGTPTAMTAAVTTVPASMAFDRPSGRGASPMSHWVHCFMDCNQLFIPEPLLT